jgi:hypothetical protein
MLGISLVLCGALLAVLTALPRAAQRMVGIRWVTVACIALLWIPVGAAHIPVVAYVRGITADLSITLIALAGWHICHLALSFRAVPKREEMVVMTVVAVAALFLYPMALGWGDWDAYRPGWGSWGMLLVLLALCLVSLAKGLRVLPALLALALLAWSFGLMESGNLWDYLLDPWLSTFALGYVVAKVFIKYVQTVISRFR